MPPLSYPLQNTLPFLALLAARCIIVVDRRRSVAACRMRLWLAHAVFVAAMLTTEFAFLLGTSLLAGEYAFAFARNKEKGMSGIRTIVNLCRQKSFHHDVLGVTLALGAYFCFRWFHPSSYEGNVLDAAFEVRRVVETTVQHAYAGTVFSRELVDVFSLPSQALLVAAIVGGITATCLAISLSEVRFLRSPLVIAAGSMLGIAYVTFPLAANARQQSWCLEHRACGYLDSRISYLAVAIIIMCLLSHVLRRLPMRGRSTAYIATASVLLGLVATATYARNWQEGQAMMADAGAWRRAALLACYPEAQPATDELLLAMIDPERRIRFHPGSDRVAFWRRYLNYEGEVQKCPTETSVRRADLEVIGEFGPSISVGRVVHFSDKSGGKYLRAGWSQPEAWGVWSDGDQAELHLMLRPDISPPGVYARVKFRLYVGPSVSAQIVTVFVNGHFVDQWTMGEDMQRSQCCERSIALPRDLSAGGLVKIAFHIANPRNSSLEPQSLEIRRLGMGITAITVGDARGKAP
jgi:hypothetical protein